MTEYNKTVYNVGYLGIGKYKPTKDGVMLRLYQVWRDMIGRCYGSYILNKRKTYIDCYVCDEWHNFQNFAEWWEKNYYEIPNEKMCLDKDILFKGNKVYSPETCIIVPMKINSLFTKTNTKRGEYPIGVNIHSNKKVLNASCSIYKDNKKVKKHLGCFPLDKPFQAFTCYKQFKENYIKQIADEYKDLIPQKLYKALYEYKVEIND